MGAVVIIVIYGEVGAILGGTINSIRRMYNSEAGLTNVLSEGFFGFFWGSISGFFISQMLFFSALFIQIGYSKIIAYLRARQITKSDLKQEIKQQDQNQNQQAQPKEES